MTGQHKSGRPTDREKSGRPAGEDAELTATHPTPPVSVSGIRRRFAEWRHGFRHRRRVNATYRMVVGVVGSVVVVVGIIAIPYPGPGWAIVFVGLAILATEFHWAGRLLQFTRRRYDAVMAWLRAQGLLVRALCALLTVLVVVLTLWVLGAAALVASWLGLDWAWLSSPVGLGPRLGSG